MDPSYIAQLVADYAATQAQKQNSQAPSAALAAGSLAPLLSGAVPPEAISKLLQGAQTRPASTPQTPPTQSTQPANPQPAIQGGLLDQFRNPQGAPTFQFNAGKTTGPKVGDLDGDGQADTPIDVRIAENEKSIADAKLKLAQNAEERKKLQVEMASTKRRVAGGPNGGQIGVGLLLSLLAGAMGDREGSVLKGITQGFYQGQARRQNEFDQDYQQRMATLGQSLDSLGLDDKNALGLLQLGSDEGRSLRSSAVDLMRNRELTRQNDLTDRYRQDGLDLKRQQDAKARVAGFDDDVRAMLQRGVAPTREQIQQMIERRNQDLVAAGYNPTAIDPSKEADQLFQQLDANARQRGSSKNAAKIIASMGGLMKTPETRRVAGLIMQRLLPELSPEDQSMLDPSLMNALGQMGNLTGKELRENDLAQIAGLTKNVAVKQAAANLALTWQKIRNLRSAATGGNKAQSAQLKEIDKIEGNVKAQLKALSDEEINGRLSPEDRALRQTLAENLRTLQEWRIGHSTTGLSISPDAQGRNVKLQQGSATKFMGQTMRPGEESLFRQAQQAASTYKNDPKALAAIQNELVKQLQARRGGR